MEDGNFLPVYSREREEGGREGGRERSIHFKGIIHVPVLKWYIRCPLGFP